MDKESLQNDVSQVEAAKRIALHSAWLDHGKWETDRNAIAGLRSISKFAKLGYSPPQDLMDWVISNFEKYLESDKSLDTIFDVSQRKKQKSRTEKTNADYVIEIKYLAHTFNITNDEAIFCLNRRLEELNINKSDTSLKDIYDRDGSRVSDKKLLDEIMREHNGFLLDIDKKRSLERYPQDVRDFLINRMQQ